MASVYLRYWGLNDKKTYRLNGVSWYGLEKCAYSLLYN